MDHSVTKERTLELISVYKNKIRKLIKLIRDDNGTGNLRTDVRANNVMILTEYVARVANFYYDLNRNCTERTFLLLELDKLCALCKSSAVSYLITQKKDILDIILQSTDLVLNGDIPNLFATS